MKKCTLLSLFFLLCFTVLYAQKKKPETNTSVNTTVVTPNQNTTTNTSTKKDTVDYDLRVYGNAVSLGDFYTAITAIHYKYAKDTNVRWLDTLSRLYFTGNMIRQAVITAEIVIQKQPNNTSMLELLALSYSGLGDSKSALAKYEKLFELTQKPYYQYQCAVEEFNLGRVGECEVRIKSIQNNPAAEKEKININAGQGKTPEQVSIKAASLNLLGVMQMKLNKNEDAKKSFEASLKLAPEFSLAKGNLEALNKPKDKK
jgi:tetratricopeptide (TPR) repeat protein